jgi:hypothetical protein
MNIVNITEDLARCLDIAYPDIGRADLPLMLKHFPKWPFLVYDFGDETKQEMDQRLQECYGGVGTIFRTPFPKFRFWMRTQWGSHYGMCEREDAGLRAVAVATDSAGKDKMIVKVFLNPANRPGIADWNVRAFHHKTGDEITEGRFGEKILDMTRQEALDRLVGILIASLEMLSKEYLRPGNHVAKVEPGKPGKSVQWIQAREHYTVINRNHAANKKGVPRGSMVNQDESKHITRIAHTRRAHDRVLRSDRYKAMRGKTIQISSTWVGPEEWKDSAGQVYRIAKISK